MSLTNIKNSNRSKIVLTVFIPFTCGYFITAFFNQVNAVISHNIIADIGLTSNTLGLMTSVYLLCFALFQLPLGLLLDRYGAKNVQFFLFIIAAIGISIFATAHSVWQLTLGRAVIGIGLAAGLMAGFKAIRLYYPKERIPLMNSIMMAAGTLGALFSTVPTEYFVTIISWRVYLVVIAIMTFIIGFAIFLLSKEPKAQTGEIKWVAQISSLKEIYQSKYFWKIAPLAAACFAMNMSMVGLWAGIWFTKVSGFTDLQSAHHLLVIAIALILGIFLNGYIANKVTTLFNKPITTVIAIGLALFLLVQVMIVFGSASGSYVLWFLFGILGRSATLSYAALAQHFSASNSGKAITAVNLLMFLTAFLMQYFIGLLIHVFHQTHWLGYIDSYKLVFLIMIIVQVIALLWFLLNKSK